MEGAFAFIVMIAVYLWLFLQDRFFRTCSFYAYTALLEYTGVSIGLFQVKWSTTTLNRRIHQLELRWHLFAGKWFDMGVIVSLILLPVALFIVHLAIYNNLIMGTAANGNSWSATDATTTGFAAQITIVPIVPGLNLPLTEMGIYSLCLFVCIVAHESGHAFAAMHEDVSISSVGARLILFMPVAYVELNDTKLPQLAPWGRLRILCAGIWHNLLTALLGYLLLMALPILLAPLYHTDKGVTVMGFTPNSPLKFDEFTRRGFLMGDVVTKIDDCPVKNEADWLDCLLQAHRQKPPAICIDSKTVYNSKTVQISNQEKNSSCCPANTSNKLCFEAHPGTDGPQLCLTARAVLSPVTNYCTVQPFECPTSHVCYKPVLNNNATSLVMATRRVGDSVIFVGPISDLFRTIHVSSYVPTTGWSNTVVIISPVTISKFLTYIVIFSIGMAIINALPCIVMDGQHIFHTIVTCLLARYIRLERLNRCTAIVTMVCTFVLIVHCLTVVLFKLL